MRRTKLNERRNINKVRLGDIADYSDTRIDCSSLCVETYIGTDNIKQNKQGKENSQYTPSTGFTTEYRKGDILIANIRPYLKKIWFATNDGGSSADVLTIRINDKEYLPKYIYYSLFQDVFFDYAMKGSKGSKMPRGDKKQILNFPIPDLSFSTQTAIADVLSSFDEKIELNNKINKELEDLARTIYEYWFVQFDFPDKNGEPYKSSGGEMVWNEKLKKEIPKKWQSIPLSDLVEILNGSTPSTDNDNYFGGDIVWITPKDLSDQKSKFTDCGERTITKEGFDSCSTNILPINSILLSSRAPIGLISIVKHELCTNQGFKNLVPYDKADASYLYFYLLHHIREIESLGTGTTFKEVSKENLLSYYILHVQNDSLYNDWVMRTSFIFEKQYSIKKESAQLAQLRDFLLPLLMNGQVTVGKAQEKTKTVLLKQTDNDTKFEVWKTQIGLAARGNIDEQTLRNIYEAIDEKDR